MAGQPVEGLILVAARLQREVRKWDEWREHLKKFAPFALFAEFALSRFRF